MQINQSAPFYSVLQIVEDSFVVAHASAIEEENLNFFSRNLFSN
jgi:hypothetical protein